VSGLSSNRVSGTSGALTHKKKRRKKMKEQITMDVFEKDTGISAGLAILMIVMGFLAMSVPLATVW